MTSAQIVDEPLETRALDGAARAAAQIVVDHLDIVEPPTPRNVDQLILPALTLKVCMNLLGRRLSDVDDGLALQECHGKKITARLGHLLLRDTCSRHQQLGEARDRDCALRSRQPVQGSGVEWHDQLPQCWQPAWRGQCLHR